MNPPTLVVPGTLPSSETVATSDATAGLMLLHLQSQLSCQEKTRIGKRLINKLY